MSMVVYTRESVDAARREGYADGKGEGHRAGYADGRAAERADVVAWHKAQSEQALDEEVEGVFVWDAHDDSAAEIAAGAHVGAAKKEGA